MSAIKRNEGRFEGYPGLATELDGISLSDQVTLIRLGWLRAHQHHDKLPTVTRTPGNTHQHENGLEYYVIGTEDGYLASPEPVEVEQ